MYTFPSHTWGTLFGVLTLAALGVLSPASAAVVYDSPAQNFITGITGVTVSGTSNDGLYDVTFVQGSFNAAFGPTTMTADLPFQSDADATAASAAVNAILSLANPSFPLGSPTAGVPPNNNAVEFYLIPFIAASTYAARTNAVFETSPNWLVVGNGFNQGRDMLLAPIFCSICTAKWAVFTPATTAPVPEPATLVLLGLAGFVVMIRRKLQ